MVLFLMGKELSTYHSTAPALKKTLPVQQGDDSQSSRTRRRASERVNNEDIENRVIVRPFLSGININESDDITGNLNVFAFQFIFICMYVQDIWF